MGSRAKQNMKGTLLGLALVLSNSALAQKTDSVAQDTKTPYGQFQAEMQSLDIASSAITLTTNAGGGVSFTVRCANEEERVRVRDVVLELNGAAQSTKEPPTVSGVLAAAVRNGSVAETAENPDTAKSISGGGASTGRASGGSSPGYRSSGTSKTPKSSGDVYVRGYYRKNGTYVQPHYRRSPSR
jgi:hypothetical protein